MFTKAMGKSIIGGFGFVVALFAFVSSLWEPLPSPWISIREFVLLTTIKLISDATSSKQLQEQMVEDTAV